MWLLPDNSAASGKIRLILATLAVLSGILCGPSCESLNTGMTPATAPGSGRSAAPPSMGSVALAPGDVLRLIYSGAPALNHTQKIRADGNVTLPVVGEVHVAGKTLPALQSELRALYQPQLQNSEVVVTLESGGAPIVVSGAVMKPGKLVFDRPTTVLEAIMEAGGFNEFANARKVQVIRVANGQHQSHVVDLRGAMRGQPTKADYIKSGDVIYVPEGAW